MTGRKHVNAFSDRKEFLFLLFYVILTVSASCYYIQILEVSTTEYIKATTWDIFRGQAYKPFQYRILIPWIIGHLLPNGFEVTGNKLEEIFSSVTYYYTVNSVTLIFLIALIFTFREYLNQFFKNNLTATIFSLSIFFVLPYNFIFDFHYVKPFQFPPLFANPLFHVYDIPSMFFFTLGLLLMHKKKWLWYYLIFALATFNRETTCFLTIIYLFISIKREPFKIISFHVIVQFILWVAIKFFLYSIYSGNPGAAFTWRVRSNLHFLSQVYYWPNVLSIMGWTWLFVLLFYRRIPDIELRRSVLAFIPFAISMFIVGNIFEFRIFGEFIPVILAAFWMILREIMLHTGGKAQTEQIQGQPSPDA